MRTERERAAIAQVETLTRSSSLRSADSSGSWHQGRRPRPPSFLDFAESALALLLPTTTCEEC